MASDKDVMYAEIFSGFARGLAGGLAARQQAADKKAERDAKYQMADRKLKQESKLKLLDIGYDENGNPIPEDQLSDLQRASIRSKTSDSGIKDMLVLTQIDKIKSQMSLDERKLQEDIKNSKNKDEREALKLQLKKMEIDNARLWKDVVGQFMTKKQGMDLSIDAESGKPIITPTPEGELTPQQKANLDSTRNKATKTLADIEIDKETNRLRELSIKSRLDGIEDKQTDSLRKEIMGNKVTRNTYELLSHARKIETAFKDVSPAGDVSILFSYMKMLDPESVVRESEYATVKDFTRTMPESLIQLYNQKVKDGTSLTPEQRIDFYRKSKALMNSQINTQEGFMSIYKDVLKDRGINEKFVIPVFPKSAVPKNPKQVLSPQMEEKKPKGTAMDPDDKISHLQKQLKAKGITPEQKARIENAIQYFKLQKDKKGAKK